MVTDRGGGANRARPLKGEKWIVGSGTHGCWLGSYEYEKQRNFAESITCGSVVYDVGAHVGFYTLLAAELVGPLGRVFSFEPLPRNIRYLWKHIALNNCTNIEVIECAVAETSGLVQFEKGPNSYMGCVSDRGRFPVQAVSLDDLYGQGKIPKVDVIKMDIEGNELHALIGARVLLREYHPRIFLATHGSEVNQRCSQFLLSMGSENRALPGGDIENRKELACVA